MCLKNIMLFCLLWAVVCTSQGQVKPTLTVGSKAPSLETAKWLKGSPVNQFTSGQLYVVEFWATWCGPCIAAMPHLSTLAEKYKDKVTFVGVSIREGKRKTAADVAGFVKENSSNMRYVVAMDDAQTNVIATEWMDKAGLAGIPATFVVDGEGRVAWIGHPDALAPVLATLLEDPAKFDRQSAKVQHDKDFYQQLSYQASKRIYTLLAEKNYGLAWQDVQKTIQDYPAFEQDNFALFLTASFHANPKQAMAFVQQKAEDDAFLKKRKANPSMDPKTDFLYEVARLIAVQPYLDAETYLWSVQYMERQIADASTANYNLWQMYAQVLLQVGAYQQAEQAQQKAILLFKEQQSKERNSMQQALSATVLEKMEQKLQSYASFNKEMKKIIH